MLKTSKYVGKMIGFIIALTLFIIANIFQSSMNSKIRDINSEIASIERSQEANVKNMLMGTEGFQNGQLYLTIGIMTRDEEHQISGVFNPVAMNFIHGLEFLNETLPEDDQAEWTEKIVALNSQFNSSKDALDLDRFYVAFSSGAQLFNALLKASNHHSETMADQKEYLRRRADGYSFYSHVLLIVNTIILLIQLFFNNLFDFFMERREERRVQLIRKN